VKRSELRPSPLFWTRAQDAPDDVAVIPRYNNINVDGDRFGRAHLSCWRSEDRGYKIWNQNSPPNSSEFSPQNYSRTVKTRNIFTGKFRWGFKPITRSDPQACGLKSRDGTITMLVKVVFNDFNLVCIYAHQLWYDVGILCLGCCLCGPHRTERVSVIIDKKINLMRN